MRTTSRNTPSTLKATKASGAPYAGGRTFIREGETPTESIKRTIATRTARAIDSHKPATREKQLKAAKYEATVAKLINGKNLDDHEPFDVIVGRHAVEVKVVLSGTNSKVTMHPESLSRKADFLRREKMTGHTVVIDARGDKPVYHYRRGVGSFRLSAMQVVKSTELRGLISTGKYAEFDSGEHPRQPAGSEKGGEFAPKGSSEEIITGADAIRAMDPDKRDNTEVQDFPGGAPAYDLYEAQKMAPKPSDKLKRVTDSNSFSLWQSYDYIANVDHTHFGVSKYEDPDEPDDESKFVFAFKRLDQSGLKMTETSTSDVKELFTEIRKHK